MRVAIPDIEPHLAHAPAGEPVPFDASDAIWSFDASSPTVSVTKAGDCSDRRRARCFMRSWVYWRRSFPGIGQRSCKGHWSHTSIANRTWRRSCSQTSQGAHDPLDIAGCAQMYLLQSPPMSIYPDLCPWGTSPEPTG